MRTDEEEIMNQTAYSQCELLALACESEAARAKPDRGRSRNRQQARQPAEREPALPNGYVHIRSAIEALMALTRSPASDAWRSLSSDTSSLG